MIQFLHSHRHEEPHPFSGGGVLLSIILHGALVLGIFGGGGHDPPPDKVMESLVQYLVPIDRHAGMLARARTGSLGYQGTGEAGSGQEDTRGTTEGDRPSGIQLTQGGGDPAPAQEEPTFEELYSSMLNDSVHSIVEVDSTVVRDPTSIAPAYPLNLLEEQIQGSAFVLYVVDSTGRVDPSSLRVIRATHPGFVRAVREALPGMRFRPAMLSGTRVAQLVQQSFAFRISKTARVDTTRH